VTGFRSAWLRTAPRGLVDFMLHVAAAWWLPGPWWFQWLPDVLMPVLWLRSVVTDRMAAEDSSLLAWHRMLHIRDRYFHSAAVFWWLATLAAWQLLGVHWAVLIVHVVVHAAIDRMTHEKGWQ